MKSPVIGSEFGGRKEEEKGQIAVLDCGLSADEIIYREVQTDDVCGFQFRD
jgi:hypothetical protein